MKPIADFHMHTVFCDGKNTPEEMVLRGIEMGLSVMGFSVHSPLWRGCTWSIPQEKMEAYKNEIHRLKEKYADKIRIYCGIEMDYLTELDTSDFDYVIGSVHHVCKGDGNIAVDTSAKVSLDGIEKHFDGDIYAYAEEYFRMVGDIVEKTNADLIGHFDLLNKFCDRGLAFDPENPRYVAAWKAAADKLLKTGVPFEINTGAISRKRRTTPYPSVEILHYILSRGGHVIFSSDAHSAENLCYEFETWQGYFRDLGFKI